MSVFSTFIPGKPLPKGSLRHVGRGRLVEQTRVKSWMEDIRADLHVVEAPMFTTPVTVSLEFFFPRPMAAKNRLYPHMRSAGDLDKLCRAVLDALQPKVLEDDALVVSLSATKRYETPECPAGVVITVGDLT